eukprot:gene15029-21100_t
MRHTKPIIKPSSFCPIFPVFPVVPGAAPPARQNQAPSIAPVNREISREHIAAAREPARQNQAPSIAPVDRENSREHLAAAREPVPTRFIHTTQKPIPPEVIKKRMPTAGEEVAAEKLKAEGKTFFVKGKYNAAVEKYTEAIVHCPGWSVLWVNRAMCHRKRDDDERMMNDGQQALALDPALMKANYLVGLSYTSRGEYESATKHLLKESAADLKSKNLESGARKEIAVRLRKMLDLNSVQPLPLPEKWVFPIADKWEKMFAAAASQDVPSEIPFLSTPLAATPFY